MSSKRDPSPDALESLRRAAAAAKKLAKGSLADAFDPAFPNSRPTEHQWEFFDDIARLQYRIARGGNQASKTATVTREMSWVFTDTHPKGWKRPTAACCPVVGCRKAPAHVQESGDLVCPEGHIWRDWGTGPLLGIVAGQSKTAMEEELWKNKMRPFFGPEWKERYRGGYLSSVVNVKTKDRILFLSHADSSEQNRKYLQTFVAHYVLLDEMPTSMKIFEELMRRADSRRGYFVAGFTPKVYSGEVRRWVDALQPPTGRVYRFSKFQNPIFYGKEEEERAKLKGLPEHAINCILFGDWMPGDGLVFWFEPNLHGVRRHPRWSASWPHVVVVDPATESKFGLLVAYYVPPEAGVVEAAAPPGGWVVSRAIYLEGYGSVTKFAQAVEKETADLNVIERVADPAATWFIRQAADMPAEMGVPNRDFSGVYAKNVAGRKNEMLVAAQEALGSKVWVELNDETNFLVDEMGTMVRSPDTNEIRKAKRYHLIDCLNYFVDRHPYALPVVQITDLDLQQVLYARWRESGGEPPPGIASVVAAEKELTKLRILLTRRVARRRVAAH